MDGHEQSWPGNLHREVGHVRELHVAHFEAHRLIADDAFVLARGDNNGNSMMHGETAPNSPRGHGGVDYNSDASPPEDEPSPSSPSTASNTSFGSVALSPKASPSATNCTARSCALMSLPHLLSCDYRRMDALTQP